MSVAQRITAPKSASACGTFPATPKRLDFPLRCPYSQSLAPDIIPISKRISRLPPSPRTILRTSFWGANNPFNGGVPNYSAEAMNPSRCLVGRSSCRGSRDVLCEIDRVRSRVFVRKCSIGFRLPFLSPSPTERPELVIRWSKLVSPYSAN